MHVMDNIGCLKKCSIHIELQFSLAYYYLEDLYHHHVNDGRHVAHFKNSQHILKIC